MAPEDRVSMDVVVPPGKLTSIREAPEPLLSTSEGYWHHVKSLSNTDARTRPPEQSYQDSLRVGPRQ